MTSILLRVLKIVGVVLALVLALLVTAGILLNTSKVQNSLMVWTTDWLSEKLGTKVSIDCVDIDFFTYDVRLYGLDFEDLQHEKMLQLEQLSANVELWPLLHHQVKISSVHVTGLHANLYQQKADSAANYQFLIEAFKKEKKDSVLLSDSVPQPDSTQVKKKVELDLRRVILERIEVKWTHFKKKGPEDVVARLDLLKLKKKDRHYQVAFQGLHVANDNRLPRKNVGKPKRGAFDAGHLDVDLNAELTVTPQPALAEQPSQFDIILHHLTATDTIAGIDLQELSLLAHATPEQIHFKNIALRLDQTTLNIDTAYLQLPSKKKGRTLAYGTSPIKAQVLLKEIAKPFAPVLSKFAIPLELGVTLKGDANSMSFRDIHVNTLDKKLTINAQGGLTNLTDKYKLALRFDVSKMKAMGDSKERIISQFPVKKLMMKELRALGTILYQGHFNVLWKHEEFSGKLTTQVGHLDFRFHLDELNKYVVGHAATKDLLLGKVFDIEGIGKIVANAQFKIDISKPRTAQMRRKKGGRIPIGTVTAHVDTCSWKKIKVYNLDADIVSDGAEATGNIMIKGKRRDLLCAFSLTKTDSVKNKLKVKPGIRFHALSEEDKTLKEERKAQKAEQKALKAEQRAQEKALKAEQKAQEKAEKEARKAEEKARKAEEKARKAEEKARKKAEKEALKNA